MYGCDKVVRTEIIGGMAIKLLWGEPYSQASSFGKVKER
jgi:hypothetical protein